MLPGLTPVRVAARRLADGRTEFALQEQDTGGFWAARRLPRSRFFPADAAVDRWLASSPLTVTAVIPAHPVATPDPACDPVPEPIASVRIADANPVIWTPPPLPDDTVCNLIGGTPWRPPEDLHSGQGAELAELRARPFVFGVAAGAPPSDAVVEDLQSLADAYERWLAAWPAAVRSWSYHPYDALASGAALGDRARPFVDPSGEWGVDWGPGHPLCSPFNRSDAWLGARIDGDRAVTYSWRRGEAARCTDAASGRELPTDMACIGPLYAVATRWSRNPAGDPPWRVVSETHRDPLAADRSDVGAEREAVDDGGERVAGRLRDAPRPARRRQVSAVLSRAGRGWE